MSNFTHTLPRRPTFLKADSRLAEVDPALVEACLKCCVASEVFDARTRGRKHKKTVLQLSSAQVEREKMRTYAGTFASELSSLSDRVRLVVSHSGTVGTYRENILQALLQRHLPERYHVATGFIQGCPRQLDVLIYDRIDYAPVFRQGDLVVVLPQAVRAVIEVKTGLDGAQLTSSLARLEEVAAVDDASPAFFKGIFAFETNLKAKDILRRVVEFYSDEPDEMANLEEYESHLIGLPYQHLTSLCVLGTAYAYVRYLREAATQDFVPTLMSGASVTDLRPQAALFLDQLLAYLRVDAFRPVKPNQFRRWLGADFRTEQVGALTRTSWGAYFSRDEGMPAGDDQVSAMERLIETNESRIWDS